MATRVPLPAALLLASGLCVVAAAACQTPTSPPAAEGATTTTGDTGAPGTAPTDRATPAPSTTTTTGAVADPGGSAGAVNCHDAVIRTEIAARSAAMGRQDHEIRLTNTGAAPCWVEGHPDVTALDADGRLVAQARAREVPWTRVVVPAGGAAHLVLRNDAGEINADGCTPRPVSTLRLFRPAFFDRTLPFEARVCADSATQLSIGPWAVGATAAEGEAG